MTKADTFELKPLLRWTLTALNTNGCDPRKSGKFSKFRYCLCFVNYSAMITLSLLDVFLNWNGYETIAKTEIFPNMFQGWCKIICIIYHRQSLVNIIENIRLFWPDSYCGEEAMREMQSLHNSVKQFFTYYTLLSTMTATSIILKPIISGDKTLLFAAYDFCDINVSPCFEVQYIWQALFLPLVMFITIMGFEAMFTCLIVYAIGALKMVKHALRHLNRNSRADDEILLNSQIQDIVQQHNIILQFVKDINKVYSTILLIQFWTSLACLTTCLFLLTYHGIPPDMDHLSKYGVLYVNLIFQLAIYSVGGSMLMDEASSIAVEAYDVNWWAESKVKYAKDFLFIMMRANKVEKIQVGGMADLNLVTYSNVVQNSISVFALLQTLYS